MSFGEVTSDTVGYQTIAVEAGLKMLVPSFNAIDGDYSIQNIKLQGDNVYGEGNETLEIVDAEGNSTETFTWYQAGYYGANEGWYNDSDYEYATRTFAPGEGALVNNDNGDFSVLYSGKVSFTKIDAYACDSGFTSVGNQTPLNKSIQKFAIAGDNVYGEGNETLEIVDSEGNSTETFTWYQAGYYGANEGWYNDSDYEYATKEIEAGTGFLLNNDNGEYVVSIPGTND